MCRFIVDVLLVSAIIGTSRTQLTNIAGSVSVSLSPTDATCGLTSAENYCRVNLAADAGCVVDTCRTVREDRSPTHRNLLRGIDSFNYEGKAVSTTKDFGDSDDAKAVFSKTTRLAFLKGTVNMTGLDEFTLSFCIKPGDMDTESSVVDIHGTHSGQRVFNVRLGPDFGITVVSGTTSVTQQRWRIPPHEWSHVAVQIRQNGVNVFLNKEDVTTDIVSLKIQNIINMTNLRLTIGQTYVHPRTEEWGPVCTEGRGKAHPTYCHLYYICEKGLVNRKNCVYPDRWSVDREQCDNFQTVNCSERISKNHPCDLEQVGYGYPNCELAKHPVNCTSQKNGLYFKFFSSFGCVVYGCIDGTLVNLAGDPVPFFPYEKYGSTMYRCTQSRLINPDTGRCDKQDSCLPDTNLYVPDSPYLRCTNDDVRKYRYDSCKYWRCQNELWVVIRCPHGQVWSNSKNICVNGTASCAPEPLDTKERQFLGELADIRLYERALNESEIKEMFTPICNNWGKDAHPIENAVDSDASNFWLSRTDLDTVDVLFDLRGTHKLEEISMTFFGPVPLVVSIFKKVMTDASWQLWRVFRDDCSDVSKCAPIGSIEFDDKRLTFNLVEANLGPLQRRASTVRVRLSGHRHEGTAQLRNISYFGLYSLVISRRESSRCGVYGYSARESNEPCQPCHCYHPGVIDGNVECNEVGGQCACKRYVIGRKCDSCHSGYDNIRENDADGCSIVKSPMTSPTPPMTSEQQETLPSHPMNRETRIGESESSMLWLLYVTPALVVVIAIVIIIAVICVRRRRLHNSAQGIDNTRDGQPMGWTAQGMDSTATAQDPNYETIPVVLSTDDEYYDDTFTKHYDDVQIRVADLSVKKIADPDDYSTVVTGPESQVSTVTSANIVLEPPNVSIDGTDYQHPVPAAPVAITPTYAGLITRLSDPSTNINSDDVESSQDAAGPDHQLPVPALPVPITPQYQYHRKTANGKPSYIDLVSGTDSPASDDEPNSNEEPFPTYDDAETIYDNATNCVCAPQSVNAVGLDESTDIR